ncbi:MAG: MgtC/SapB family protein [Lachnospiraceae bacterium]|nr:MgtC/SapB family protein [Lachnospiraceae bacterium]
MGFEMEYYFQLELIFRIFLAGVLGAVIGYERKNRDKSAGTRTHAMVCLGAALLMVISKYCFPDVADYDASRVASQIVSGVGFLGTGMIFVKNSTVSGLTTAAGVWTTAGIGMAVGAGAYWIGIAAALIMIVMQIVMHKMNPVFAENVRDNIKLTTDQYESVMKEIQEELNLKKNQVAKL